jgi:hypothetical protein
METWSGYKMKHEAYEAYEMKHETWSMKHGAMKNERE